MLWVGGWWSLCCRCRCCCDFVCEGAAGGAPGVGVAGAADGKGVLGDALVDGGVLTVPWGWDLATPHGGSRGHCWLVLAVPGVGALLGVVGADGVVGVVPGGFAVVAVVDVPDCCR